MRTISVEPEQVEASAARMDDQNQSYQRTYAQLFEAVDTMKSGKRQITCTYEHKRKSHIIFSHDMAQRSLAK